VSDYSALHVDLLSYWFHRSFGGTKEAIKKGLSREKNGFIEESKRKFCQNPGFKKDGKSLKRGS